VFTLEGKYVTQVFVNRDRAGEDVAGGGIAFSPDSEQRFMYVAENGSDYVIVFERKTLEILAQVGKKSAVLGNRNAVTVAKPGEFQGVHYLAVDSKGNLYTGEVDSGNRVQRFVFKGFASQTRQ
jgi:sugar lactone lactonase YvrE